MAKMKTLMPDDEPDDRDSAKAKEADLVKMPAGELTPNHDGIPTALDGRQGGEGAKKGRRRKGG